MMSRIRWGVLSTARIATEKVIPAMQAGDLCEIAAIASRDLARAQAAAESLGIPTAYGSYEQLVADPEIDAIYNPLPNDLHVPWTIRAIESGKHVLCEKPIGMDAADALRLIDAQEQHPGIRVMEAFMYRFHPQWQAVRRLVEDGAIGRLRHIQSSFSYFNADPENIRNIVSAGGGALMDIGCYCISLSRWLFGSEPIDVSSWRELDPVFETDILTTGMLRFEAGTAGFVCSTQMHPSQRVTAIGTKGRIEIDHPFYGPPEGPCRVRLTSDEGLEELLFESANHYTLQGDAFSRSILKGEPVPTPLGDALANMRVIDALRSSAAIARSHDRH
jgi:predicted dehydrogenase